ncbi:hypothetical protein [Flavobacterium anhuiense]|uniref:hypothetical protein n=1 Tax=Flavobacterium anhuiense TaxID=459526 RepID=UPI003D983FF7
MKLKYLGLIVFVSIFFTSCASGATIEGMTVKDYKTEKKVGDKIFIKSVTGGKKTNPLWTSKISNENFEEAFKKSVVESEVFSKITSITNDDDWVLEINLVSVDQPFFGATFTVKTAIEYKLYYQNKLMFSKNIKQSGSARTSDALIGVKRLRLANEVSAKNNIKEFLQSLNEIAP